MLTFTYKRQKPHSAAFKGEFVGELSVLSVAVPKRFFHINPKDQDALIPSLGVCNCPTHLHLKLS